MITVKIVRGADRRVIGVFMSGHAGYAEEGSDIICAGASTLIYTLANSLERICGIDAQGISKIKEDGGDGDVRAEIIIPYGTFTDKTADDRAAVVAETIYTGFISLASSVNADGMKYIDIIEDYTEV